MRKAPQVRYQLFLPKSLGERFEQLANAPGVTKSTLLAPAVDAWLNRRGTDELEQRFATRLDRLSNHLARIERNGHVELESPALFIRYMLAVNAPLPEGDEAARAIGRDRFAALVERAGQQLASGRSTLIPEDQR